MEENKDKKQTEIVELINDFPSKEEEARLELERKQIEANFQRLKIQNEKRIALKNKLKKVALIAVVIAVIGALIFIFFQNRKNAALDTAKKTASVALPENSEHVFVNDTQGVLEPVEVVDETRGLIGRSENFQIKDLVFGGETMVIAGETENLPIAVTDVRSESLMSKDGKEVKLLISWKTNKLAQSAVKYRKDTLDSEKILKEGGYGFSHALILAKLEPATRFFFTVEASDRQGKIGVSETFAVFTGSKPISVFDLIANEVNKMFGWALK
ncbi:MAG: hypothetical protein HGA36_02770 [Candidatus Moranbacteria bacterium]|nr:hypothetical protein [Candidatus Moranbacteria bacterium]